MYGGHQGVSLIWWLYLANWKISRGRVLWDCATQLTFGLFGSPRSFKQEEIDWLIRDNICAQFLCGSISWEFSNIPIGVNGVLKLTCPVAQTLNMFSPYSALHLPSLFLSFSLMSITLNKICINVQTHVGRNTLLWSPFISHQGFVK